MHDEGVEADTGPHALRHHPTTPPTRARQLRWYGPGLLWMLSSVGSGSVLFTPRVGARYGYELLWAALVIVGLMWIMIREVGRYTVVTGQTILDGYREVPGPRNWAIWFVLLPQLVAGVVTIAGIAALVGSALMIALPGGQGVYAAGVILASGALVLGGRYRGVERAALLMSAVLVGAVVVAAAGVVTTDITSGLVPAVPSDLDLYFVLPWLGFILAGAAGIMWFSYWVAAREYGGAADGNDDRGVPRDDVDERIERVRTWTAVMSRTAAIGVVGGGIIVVSFLVLGAELLAPQGTVPAGIDVARDLTQLLSGVWGTFGEWLLLAGIVIALWGTVFADQDGWARTYADATLLLAGGSRRKDGRRTLLQDRDRLYRLYLVVAMVIAPLAVFLLVRDPVDILSVAGIVAAAHTPVVVGLTLWVNRRLPREVRPGPVSQGLLLVAAVLFAAFALLYLLDLVGVRLL